MLAVSAATLVNGAVVGRNTQKSSNTNGTICSPFVVILGASYCIQYITAYAMRLSQRKTCLSLAARHLQ